MHHPPPSPSAESSSEVTPPYLARSLPTSSTSSRTHPRRRQRHRTQDNDSDTEELPTSAKLLSHLVSRYDHRDTKHIRTLLVLTTDRLDAETRRADQAEQRAVDAFRRLRDAHEATALAQTDATRARQEARLHQIQFEQAQREISRAEELVNQLEQARTDAEGEAASARDTARKLREQLVFSKAREEGRKEGYDEGFRRGRAAAMAEAEALMRKRSLSARPTVRRSPPSPLKSQSSVEQADNSGSSESSVPVPAPIQRAPSRTPARSPSAPIPVVHRVTPPILYSNLDRYVTPPRTMYRVADSCSDVQRHVHPHSSTSQTSLPSPQHFQYQPSLHHSTRHRRRTIARRPNVQNRPPHRRPRPSPSRLRDRHATLLQFQYTMYRHPLATLTTTSFPTITFPSRRTET